MNEPALSLDLSHLKRVGQYLLAQSKTVKRERERKEWLGDAVLRENVLQIITSVCAFSDSSSQLLLLTELTDTCCSNAVLAFVWEYTVVQHVSSYQQPYHNTKWKADVVEAAIGALCVEKQQQSSLTMLDEILAVVFAVSLLGKDSNANNVAYSRDRSFSVASFNSNHFDQRGLFDSDEGKEEKEEKEDTEISTNSKEEEGYDKDGAGDTVRDIPGSSLRMSSILGGAALQASVSLALYQHCLRATPQLLTHTRQNVMCQKQQQWKIWEDGRTFDGNASSPVKICRTGNSGSREVCEWVTEQMTSSGSGSSSGLRSSIDVFCWYLAKSGDGVSEKTSESSKNSSSSSSSSSSSNHNRKRRQHQRKLPIFHSYWRHAPFAQSQRTAYAALLEHGVSIETLSIPVSSLKRKRTERGGSGSEREEERTEIQKKKRTMQHNQTRRPRGPSITISKQDMELLCRFCTSNVVAEVETLLHSNDSLGTINTNKSHIIVLKEGLDRRICHALCGAHSVASRSITIQNEMGEDVRGVEIFGCGNNGDVGKCTVMADLIEKSG